MSNPHQLISTSKSTLPAASAQALRKACSKGQNLAWLTLPSSRANPDPRPRLVWLRWQEQRAVLVVGGGEQKVPHLLEATANHQQIQVTVRAGDTKARIATWPCLGQVLEPESPAWGEAAQLLAAGRLNGPVAAPALPQVWKEQSRLIALDPVVDSAELACEYPSLSHTASSLPDTALTQTPVPTPAATR